MREEYPDLFDRQMKAQVVRMLEQAVDCETQFAEDLLQGGVAGLTVQEVRQYLEYVADQRLANLGLPNHFGTRNPLTFMELQDVQELSNFFERRVSAYQVAVGGQVAFNEEVLAPSPPGRTASLGCCASDRGPSRPTPARRAHRQGLLARPHRT